MKLERDVIGQDGFTMIELIMVIVILGILAATALPKFVNLTGDARHATVRGAEAALKSTAAMVHAKYLIDPAAYATTMNIGGIALPMNDGYPSASVELAQVAGVGDDYDVAVKLDSLLSVSAKGANPDTCKVTYEVPDAGGPIISLISAPNKCL